MTTNDYIKGVKNYQWNKFNGKLWQRSFIDRILRNYEIGIKKEYIKNNPKNWDK
jgi:REP element-mobilizing transposase RayT